MSETENRHSVDSFIVRSIEEIKSDVKSIYTRLGTITVDLQDYKNQRYKCLSECDMRFLKLSEVENAFKKEQERHTDKKESSAHRKTGIVVNIINILTALAPYVAIVSAFIILNK